MVRPVVVNWFIFQMGNEKSCIIYDIIYIYIYIYTVYIYSSGKK